MEYVLGLVFNNPMQAMTVIAILLACFFARELFKKFKEEVSDLKKTADNSGRQLLSHQKITTAQFQDHKKMLDEHKDDMGKFTKAVSGELLKTSERLFELKQEMIRELLQLKAMSTDTERNMVLANEVSKLAIESLNEKLGRVILIEKSLETYGAQITKMQTGIGEQASHQARNTQWFSSIAQALKAQKDQLQKLESDFKKGSKNEI